LEAAKDILFLQYQTAVELYKHEDNLNWRKLNNLFYITAGLLAVVGFFLEKGGDSFVQAVGVTTSQIIRLVGATGILVCLAFEIALWYGVKYMQQRKAVVMELEEALRHLGGAYVVAPKQKSGEENILRRSPTTFVLRLLPLLLLGVWIYILSLAN